MTCFSPALQCAPQRSQHHGRRCGAGSPAIRTSPSSDTLPSEQIAVTLSQPHICSPRPLEVRMRVISDITSTICLKIQGLDLFFYIICKLFDFCSKVNTCFLSFCSVADSGLEGSRTPITAGLSPDVTLAGLTLENQRSCHPKFGENWKSHSMKKEGYMSSPGLLCAFSIAPPLIIKLICRLFRFLHD